MLAILVALDLWLLFNFIILCKFVRGDAGLPDVALNQPHHGYYGDVITLLAVIINFWPLAVLGVFLRADDTFQHAVQVFDTPTYQSLVHRWYGKYLWPLKWVQHLTAWVQDVMKRL